MLNQVFVFGYFHADLHPANLFVLPGDAIGYVDFGIVGQLPDRVRDSLTRYSWLLFRGEVEGAVRELMRWLAPGTGDRPGAASRQLIRVHQAFLYDTVAGRSRVTAGAPGPRRNPTDNPYSKLAVDILADHPRPRADDVGEHRLLPQDARDPRDAAPPARGRIRPVRERPPLRPPPGSPAGPGPAGPAPDRSTGCSPVSGRSSAPSSSSSSPRAWSRSSSRRPTPCSGSAAGCGTSVAGSSRSGSRCWSSAASCTSSWRSGTRHEQMLPQRDARTPGSIYGLLALLVILSSGSSRTCADGWRRLVPASMLT